MNYAVWSDAAGGFVTEPGHPRDAHAGLNALLAQGESVDDLTIEVVCEWHPERVAHACEECG